jgi:hypothetical protein
MEIINIYGPGWAYRIIDGVIEGGESNESA